MSVNKPEKINNVQFSRDTKVDYKKGDPFINCIFKQYDKDLSGDFNDEEYDLYKKHLEKMANREKEIQNIKINNKTVEHYDKQILRADKKFEELGKEMESLHTSEIFEKLLEFEKAHPSVNRMGCSKDEEIPENAVKCDISAFEMGIYDEKTDSFTGEIYEKGYITGLETLSEDEKAEYLKLFEDTKNVLGKYLKLREREQKYEEQLDKAFALRDMAQNGLIKKVGSEEYENQAYQTYVNIRQQSNPFYKEIQEIEEKYNKMTKKAHLTKEDKNLLQQYKIQLDKLEKASKEWSISDMDETQKVEFEKGFNITDLSEQVSCQDGEKSLTFAHSIGASYSDENKNLNASFAKEETYKRNEKTQHTYNLNLNGEYSRNDLSINANSNFYANNQGMINFTQDAGVKYKNTSLNLSETVSSMKLPDENGNLSRSTTSDTNVSLSHSMGNFTNKLSANFAEYGNSYSLSTDAGFNVKASEGLYLNINPSLTNTYNVTLDSYTLNPSLGTGLNYSSNNINANVRISDDFSTTVQHGAKPQINNNLNISTGVSFKGIETNLKFNDNYSPYSHTQTYGAEVSYTNEKAGRFALGYDYSSLNSGMITAKYSLPIDRLIKRSK